MNTTIKSKLLFGLLFCTTLNGFGQIDAYQYRARINDAVIGWNTIDIPIAFFTHSENNLHDIRIYHHPADNEKAVEQPYIFDIQQAETSLEDQSPKIINAVVVDDAYSYTFELTNTMTVNKMSLNFKNQNFDWKVKLEGSMDQNSWATIVNDYRITSFKRDGISFKLTDLNIPDSKFNFYKITFQSVIKPELESVEILKMNVNEPNYKTYEVKNINRKEDEESKTSIIELDLDRKTPIDQLAFTTAYAKAFYRPFKIEGLIDSFSTEKGWQYNFQHLYSGTINSLNEHVFKFKPTIANKLKITVYNYDDQPLPFFKFVPKGPNYRLITRLDTNENLHLAYGNALAKKPKYDITYFKEKVPEVLNAATLEEPTFYPQKEKASIFDIKNKWWLWGIMILVILLIGTFTLKMVREEKD